MRSSLHLDFSEMRVVDTTEVTLSWQSVPIIRIVSLLALLCPYVGKS
jgi:hypothetical protein